MSINLLLAILTATAALAASISQPPQGLGDLHRGSFTCGSRYNEKHGLVSKELAEEEAAALRKGTRSTQEIHVEVYMHVLAPNETSGDISDTTLHSQIDALNAAYAPAGISFSLKGIDRTVNSTWASDQDGKAMRRHLRRGRYKDLNIYFIPALDVFGYATLPMHVDAGDEASGGGVDFFDDGCTVRSDTVPGGQAAGYNLGLTAAHEVGHWFGLLHTFEGGCAGEGDLIDDTPPEGMPTIGCPEEKDTCPEEPGIDPIHNYMDYSTDVCYTEFTSGQIQRMTSFWNKYRA